MFAELHYLSIYQIFMQKQKLTIQKRDKLVVEMQEIISRIFEEDTYIITRIHTQSEQERLEKISEILKHCEIIK